MQIDFIAEGIKEELDEFETWWSTRTLPLTSTMPDGTKGTTYIQAGLRPRRAYTLVFPKEYLGAVMNTLNPENCVVSRVDGKGTKQFGTMLRWMRRLLKLKKLPEKNPDDGMLPMRLFKNVRVVGLGVREDIDVKEADGSTHEGL